jgi:hypothetical protein
VMYKPLINHKQIHLPPLHIKLGLMIKQFVKALDQYGTGILHLKITFPRMSDSNIKDGIFVRLK